MQSQQNSHVVRPGMETKARSWDPMAPIVAIALGVVVAEVALGLRYPLFRDELYYLSCARHLDWGYVDHPPLSIWLLAAWRAAFGESALALRVPPALAAGALVVLTSRLAVRLQGGAFAALAAALFAAVTPGFLGGCGIFSMNSFDLVFWAAALLIVARLADGAPAREWLWLGVVVGLGLLNKWSLLFFLAGLGVAQLVTPMRSQLRRWQLWAGLGIVGLLNLPHLAWQVTHGWPTLEFIHNASQYKNAALSLGGFALGQVFELGPASLPVWLSGLALLLAARGGRARPLGVIYLVAFFVIALQGGKVYYLKPAYPPLLAAGAVLLERLSHASVRNSALGLVVAAQLAITPFALPVLPVDRFIAFSEALGQKPHSEERTDIGPLPQFFADRFGWEELTDKVAAVYASLSPEERAKAAIVADNYGEAAALDYYGPRVGLPPAASQHNNYFLWGPGTSTLDVAILVGQGVEGALEAFSTCEEKGRLESPYAMPHEKRRAILLCRGLKVPLEATWREGRHFI